MQVNKPGRLNVGIIGAGKVGPVLAKAIAGAGHKIVAISAAGQTAQERVESMLPGVAVKSIDEVISASQLVIFAVPSTELAQLIAGLTKAAVWQTGQLVAHTAAEYGYGVFAPAMQKGVIPFAVHPTMVFSGTSLDVVTLRTSRMAVTAPDTVLPIAQALAVEIGCEPFVIAEKDRPLYGDCIAAAREMSAAIAAQTSEKLAEIGVEPHRQVASSFINAAVSETLRTGATSPLFEID